MIKSSKFVSDLIQLVSEESYYKNKYPYNLLYWDGKRWSADCLNLVKALLNGRDITDKRTGSYQVSLGLTGDCTESQLIGKCTDVSTDFGKLAKGVPELLYMSGHVGTYLGKEVVSYGKTYNVVECTTNFGGGIVFSYVDNAGTRFSHKGGTKSLKWEKHGKLTKWIEYEKVSAPSPTKKTCPYPVPTYTLKKGAKGLEVKWLQWYLVELGFLAKKYDGVHDSVDGSFGGATDKALRKFQAAYPETGAYNSLTRKWSADGKCGPATRKKLISLI